jgi:hypothetical protein
MRGCRRARSLHGAEMQRVVLCEEGPAVCLHCGAYDRGCMRLQMHSVPAAETAPNTSMYMINL